MTWIGVVPEDEATGELKELYARIRTVRGKLSNIMAAQSLSPRAMEAHLELYTALLFGRSGLNRAERELLAVVVSAANGCAYCVAHHAAALRVYWRDEDRVRAIARDHRHVDLSPRERAMADYAVLLTRAPASVEERHVAELRAAGLGDAEILNVNLITGYFNFVNRLANGLGVDFGADEVEGYRF